MTDERREGAPSPQPDADAAQLNVRRWVRRVASVAVLAGVTCCALYFLFWPLCPENTQAAKKYLPPERSPSPTADDPRLDVYLTTDASGSTRKNAYRALEAAILKHDAIKLGAKDRISYSLFGAGTWPSTIAAASGDLSAWEGSRNMNPPGGFTDLTNFVTLFRNIRDAIKRERKENARTGITKHTDLVIVISDGVPDVEGHHRRCPAMSDDAESFIPQAVR